MQESPMTRLSNSIVTLSSLPPIKVQVPAPNEQQNQITTNKGNENSKVPPARAERDAQRLIELVADAVGAVFAIRGLVVDDVAWSTGGEK